MMRIAILGGTGALGGALSGRLAAAGHQIWIGSRDPAKARVAAEDIKAADPPEIVCGAGLAEAAASAEIIFLTVPYSAHAVTIAEVREMAQGKIVVDATVPLMPPEVGTVQLPATGSAAVEAAHLFGAGVRVVSALQNIGAEKLSSGGHIDGDVLVAGDDQDAVEIVRSLLDSLDMKSWHIGPLANSAASEAMTSVLIQINRRYKLIQAGIRITGKPKREDTSSKLTSISIRAVDGLPLFTAGDDLAGAIADRLDVPIADGDVLVVAQKIVSKVEGRQVRLGTVPPSLDATNAAEHAGKNPEVVELIQRESQELMRVAPGVIISRHRSGQVLANAGIDASNVSLGEGEFVLLWPEDADASARRLRLALEARFGVKIAVIISDSMGRAWRRGTAGTAIGVSGMKALNDLRGEKDLFGRTLEATIVGVADEIASAASLVIGEGAEGLPVAVVSGARYIRDEDAGIQMLVRPLKEDLFR
jgi:coenzyme F420-0:L-glutamate ligase/NADPH-dependent F420 reductase